MKAEELIQKIKARAHQLNECAEQLSKLDLQGKTGDLSERFVYFYTDNEEPIYGMTLTDGCKTKYIYYQEIF